MCVHTHSWRAPGCSDELKITWHDHIIFNHYTKGSEVDGDTGVEGETIVAGCSRNVPTITPTHFTTMLQKW